MKHDRVRNSLPFRIGTFVCAGLLLAGLPAGAQGARPDALVEAAGTGLGAAERALVERIEQRPTSSRVRLVRFPDLQRLESGKPFRLTLAPGLALDVEVDGLEPRGVGSFTLVGSVEGDEPGGVVLAFENGQAAGTIRHGLDLYEVQWVGRGLHALIEIDQSAYPPEHAGPNPSGGGPMKIQAAPGASSGSGGSPEKVTAASGTPVIRIYFVYTPAAVLAYGGNIASLIHSAIAHTNTAYSLSGVNAKVELAGYSQVAYTEASTSSHEADLTAFKNTNDNVIDNVHTLRNEHYADLMVMLVNKTTECGRGYVNSTAATAFSTVHVTCVSGYTVAHEIGHNAGGLHDDDPSSSPYSYGHGTYKTVEYWRTIMGVNKSLNDFTPRILRYSNPNVAYGGVATGDTSWRNVARVWNERAATLAGFRSTPPCAAIPDYTRVWYPFDETSGTIVNNLTPGLYGTAYNGPTPVPAIVSNGLSFDGSNDYVRVLNGAGLNFGYGDLSVSGWIKTTQNTAAHSVILEKRPTDVGSFSGYSVHLYNGKLGIQLADSVGYTNFDANAPFVADGYWHHFAITVDRDQATGIRYYLDGQEVGQANPTARSGNLTSSADLLIGTRYNQTGFFQGTLDELQLFGKVLSSYEVRSQWLAAGLGVCRPQGYPNLFCEDLGPEWWCQSNPVNGFGPFTWQWSYTGNGTLWPNGNTATVYQGGYCSPFSYNEISVLVTNSFGLQWWDSRELSCN